LLIPTILLAVSGGTACLDPHSRLSSNPGTFTEFPLTRPLPSRGSDYITQGPDGNLWFTEDCYIARITPDGTLTEFGLASFCATQIVSGVDGNLWFINGHDDFVTNVTTQGVIDQFPLIQSEPPGGLPQLRFIGLASGNDGALWMTSTSAPAVSDLIPDLIARIALDGNVSLFTLKPFSYPQGITSGPDGNLWFAELGDGTGDGVSQIGTISQLGQIRQFALPNTLFYPRRIAVGPDRALWFTCNQGTDAIGRITVNGDITAFPLADGIGPAGITAGPDNNMWFVETSGNALARITPAGEVTEFLLPTPGAAPLDITTGPDGNLWFTESAGDKVGRFVPP
jgi:virginiamycin B lyase